MPGPKQGFHNPMPVALKPTAKRPMPGPDEKTPKANLNAVQIRMKDRGFSLAKPHDKTRAPTPSEEATTVPNRPAKAVAVVKGDDMQDDLSKSMAEMEDLIKGRRAEQKMADERPSPLNPKAAGKVMKSEAEEQPQAIEYEFPALKPGSSLLVFDKFPEDPFIKQIETGDFDPSPSKKILLPKK